MKALKITFQIIRNIIAVALLVFAVTVFVMYATGNRFYVVKSGSMEPAIKTGDLVIVNKNYDYNKIIPGDIVCFESVNSQLVTHRAISVTESGIETQGDANNMSDGITTTLETYRGKEWLNIPKIGALIARVMTRRGKILIVTAMVVIIIASFIPGIDGKKPKKDNETDNDNGNTEVIDKE